MKVPILMYHKVAPLHPGAAVPGHYVHPKQFRVQMQLLRRLGYETTPLETLFEVPLPKKPVVITFDDGYENYFTNALPILRQQNLSGTVFLVSGRIGQTDDWDVALSATRERLMTREQILAAAQQGTEFGSHSVDHADLPKCSPEQLFYQLGDSRAALESLLGKSVLSFCYPYGRKNPEVVEAVRKAGYAVACSTERGSNDAATNRLALRRANIRSDTWTLSFLLKLLRPVRNAA